MPWYENHAGRRLWYEERGEGPPLVLIHGWCMSSAIWRFQLGQLSSSFRVIAPDLSGHGRSLRISEGCDPGDFAADIAALFHHLNLSDALLTGWSLGAQAALQALPLIGERLAGLILICTTPCFAARDDFPHGLSRLETEGMSLKVRRNLKRALEGFTARMFAIGELDDLSLAKEVARVLADVAIPDTDVALRSLSALVDADLRDQLALIGCSTLIISGERDVICPSSASAYMAKVIPVCDHLVLAGCGHAPFLTRSEVVNRCLVEFRGKVHGS